eukprot:m.200170 g.200170  ORF g.200170 m.200170 type:complete len:85 (-) comp18401_c0_seq2:95-349(-)
MASLTFLPCTLDAALKSKSNPSAEITRKWVVYVRVHRWLGDPDSCQRTHSNIILQHNQQPATTQAATSNQQQLPALATQQPQPT